LFCGRKLFRNLKNDRAKANEIREGFSTAIKGRSFT
jgi:hypothetical protein